MQPRHGIPRPPCGRSIQSLGPTVIDLVELKSALVSEFAAFLESFGFAQTRTVLNEFGLDITYTADD